MTYVKMYSLHLWFIQEAGKGLRSEILTGNYPCLILTRQFESILEGEHAALTQPT